MPIEKDCYRDNLERIVAAFPNKELLRVFEVAKFLGLERHTVSKYFTFKNGYISVSTLAREMP